MLHADELRKKSVSDLQSLAKETKLKISKNIVKIMQEKDKDVQKIRNLKKDYARILTVLNEKGKENHA